MEQKPTLDTYLHGHELSSPALSDERWRSLVSPYYADEIVVGRDLLAF